MLCCLYSCVQSDAGRLDNTESESQCTWRFNTYKIMVETYRMNRTVTQRLVVALMPSEKDAIMLQMCRCVRYRRRLDGVQSRGGEAEAAS
jgi:hypothetical protein